MTNLARTKNQEVVPALTIIEGLISEELKAGYESGIEHYRKAGEWMLKAKVHFTDKDDTFDRDGWLKWIRRRFDVGEDQANRYIKLTHIRARAPITSISSVTDKPRDPSHRPEWTDRVKAIVDKVNVDTFAQEQQARQREQQLIRDLGFKLIDIGYRALAAKLHPDKGGSTEAMARLSKVRDILKEAL